MPSQSFSYTGSEQTWTVPDGVTTVTIKCWGAGGEDGASSGSAYTGPGGTGGYAETTLSVTPGETLYIYVGGQGSGATGGWPNGGNGGSTTLLDPTGAGGGSSDVRQGGSQGSNIVCLAAGGGGGSASDTASDRASAGGDGGGTSGQDGGDTVYNSGGAGGSQGSYATGANAASGGGAVAGAGGGGASAGGAGTHSGDLADAAGGGGGASMGETVTTGAGNTGDGEVVIEWVEPANAPAAVTCSYVADDELDLSIDADTSGGPIDHYDVEVRRDGDSWVPPAGGPRSPSYTGDPQTESYGPASKDYAGSVGIDSSYEFRVRAVNSQGASDWTYSGTVHTSPLPPHNPSVSRPDGETWEFTFTHQSDVGGAVDFYYREDTGDGYGGWVKFDNLTGLTTGTTYTKTISTATSSPFGAASPQADARYQWKIDTYANPGANTALRSDDVYADYGTVFFEDDFESGDLSAWDATSNATAYQNENSAWMGLDGADEGSYSVRITGDGYVETNLGDLSGESNVLVRLAFASGHANDDTEAATVEWYDGSTWQTLASAGWAYNVQGWHERHVLVPDSYLSTDNRLRISGFASSDGSSESGGDRVVVSDLLDEYTTPAAPSSLSLDTSTQREITGSWTDNATFESRYRHDIKRSSEGSYTASESPEGTTSNTWTALLDGERYDTRVLAYIEQSRRGSGGTFFNSAAVTATATTMLPAPTSHQYANVTRDGADHSWTNNHNYGSVKIQARHDGSGWQDVITDLSRSTESYTIASFLDGEQYDVRVVAVTEHTQTEDA